MKTKIHLITPALAMTLACLGHAQEASFYKEKNSLFSTRPPETQRVVNITRFGPVGISLDLTQPAFTMLIKGVEPGSPAEKAGLEKGQVIESINGEALKDIDPRIQLGNLITKAEANDGKLHMQIADKPGGKSSEVVVQLEPMGSYSKTWPLNCPKSDKIVRNFANYLKQEGADQGFADIGMLFLLSTGDASDLEYVSKWARAHDGKSTFSWHIGYGGLALCEYYLRTGDAEVLPAIQKMADHAVATENFGGWAGRGATAALSYGGGGGHLNAGGTLCAAYLIMAKECGADVPHETLERVVRHFYRFAGRGNNSYGNNRPEQSFVDNGKNGLIAFAMAAAASLTPEGEDSVYSNARDAAAMTSFYTTGHMLHGHTGGGIGEIWRSNAMGLLQQKKTDQYQSFMDERRWHYEMSRRFDGSFAILGGARYDNTEWGAGYALAYTVPRKTLRLTGAPRTDHSKPYELPKRPWGTAADEAFLSLAPATFADGSTPDVSGESLPVDSGKPFIDRMNAMERVSDDLIRQYAHHPDYLIRMLAARHAVGVGFHYMGGAAGGEVRGELVLELLRSKDARVRKAILVGLNQGLSGELAAKHLTKEMFEELVKMLKDPDESWYAKDSAMVVMGYAPADWLVSHVDLILGYLDHQEWWLIESALQALGPIAADERTYQKVLPRVGKLLRENHNYQILKPIRWGIFHDSLREAKPEIREMGMKLLKEAYAEYEPLHHKNDQVNTRVNETIPEVYVEAITRMPGGFDMLYEIGKQRYPDQELPYRELFLKADSSQFSPKLREAVNQVVGSNLIPQYVTKHQESLIKEAKSLAESRGAKMPGLIELYEKVGIDQYSWKQYGPEAEAMQWNYFSFDPKEKFMKSDDRLGRYREVTFPDGMKDWFAVSFDPSAHGWKQGLAPFGAADGKLERFDDMAAKLKDQGGCKLSFCGCHKPPNTLWEKDVLMIRGDFEFPEFEEGYRYRLLYGGISHVGSGGGYRIYVNGKLFHEDERGIDRRAGEKPEGKIVPADWWGEFDGPVTISAITFKKNHPRTKKFGGNISIFMQRQKVPPVGE